MPQDRREYHGDVTYEVWRSGGNPDRLDYDRVEDHRWNDLRPNEAARCELNRWRCQREAQQMQHDQEHADLIQAEQEYYAMEDEKRWAAHDREHKLEQEYGPRLYPSDDNIPF
jgi:hypothetical protein